MDVKFNINGYVRVRLTDAGRAALRRYHEDVFSVPGRKLPLPEYTPPREDADGWSRWQMWDLMGHLGDALGWGNEVPFLTEIIIEVES